MWLDTTAARKAGLLPGEYVLLEEACRMADRLDALAEAVSDGGLLRTVAAGIPSPDGEGMIVEVRVIINGALAEARLTAQTLRQVLASLGQASMAATPASTGDPKGDPLDEIGRARAARLAAQGGGAEA